MLRQPVAKPAAVNRRGGPRRWPPLLYVCYSRVELGDGAGAAIAAARVLLERGADPNAHFMWGGRYRFTALTGAIGEGEAGLRNQPPHPQARELVILLLEAGADPNDAQGLYNSQFSSGDQWLQLLLRYGLSAKDRINWKSSRRAQTLDYLLSAAAREGLGPRVDLLLRAGRMPAPAITTTAGPTCITRCWAVSSTSRSCCRRMGRRPNP